MVDTKTKSSEAITEANRWINGLDFLWQDKKTWPHYDSRGASRALWTSRKQNYLFHSSQQVDESLKRFSLWLQLKRGIAWMLRFKNQLRNVVAKRRSDQNLSFAEVGKKIPPLDELEVEKAGNVIIKYVQTCTFQEKILMLLGDVRGVK